VNYVTNTGYGRETGGYKNSNN